MRSTPKSDDWPVVRAIPIGNRNNASESVPMVVIHGVAIRCIHQAYRLIDAGAINEFRQQRAVFVVLSVTRKRQRGPASCSLVCRTEQLSGMTFLRRNDRVFVGVPPGSIGVSPCLLHGKIRRHFQDNFFTPCDLRTYARRWGIFSG